MTLYWVCPNGIINKNTLNKVKGYILIQLCDSRKISS
jgi:hypothetical protein